MKPKRLITTTTGKSFVIMLTLLISLFFSRALFGQIITNSKTTQKMGSVLIFYGGAEPDLEYDTVLSMGDGSNSFGKSVSNAGDFNNDGYSDIIIGAPEYNAPGAAYLYLGGEQIDNTPFFSIEGDKIDGQLGSSISYAGDVNGDGYSDINIAGYRKEETFLVLGASTKDNIELITLKNEQSDFIYGKCVAFAGDMNNDGFDDIIIGDANSNVNGNYSGMAFVYFGGDHIDTIPDLLIKGQDEYDDLGEWVAFAGDVNGDGFSDVLVGSPGYRRYTDNVNPGRIDLYYGSAEPDNIPDLTIREFQWSNIYSYMSGIGDINNDGFDDFAVGDPYTGQMGGAPGYVYIYLGNESIDTIPEDTLMGYSMFYGNGFSEAGDFNNDGYDDFLVLGHDDLILYFGGTTIDNDSAIVFNGTSEWLYYNRNCLAHAGDLNNDGYSDVILGLNANPLLSIKPMNIEKNNPISVNIFPNPASISDEVFIKYILDTYSEIEIKVYSTMGKEIDMILKETQSEGEHTAIWKPGKLPPGEYYIRITTALFSHTQSIVVK